MDLASLFAGWVAGLLTIIVMVPLFSGAPDKE